VVSVPDLSVVVPVFNEEQNLPVLAGEIAAALEGAEAPGGRQAPEGRRAPEGRQALAYEVLLVDDGSTDGSPRVLAELAARDRRLRVLRLPRNRGQSAALAIGFRHARGRLTATLDGDLQNDPADLPRLLAELETGAAGEAVDVVCGVRAKRRDTWVRRVSSRVANGVRNRLTAESIADVGCTLRVYRTAFVADLPMFDGMHRFLPTLLRLAGARIKEVPVHHRPRLHGTPKYNIRNRIWRALVDLFAVRWMQRRWIDRRLVEEIPRWNPRLSGSSSDSPDRASSSAASSSSGSPPRNDARATSRRSSGS
jgi:glycosyltransferase involved in cell wall biosynthesis